MRWPPAAVLLLAVLLRVITSASSYSGMGKPPMFGDYEAQRHWMEITVNLPVRDWYKNTTDNDLMYWGLDYPPLTAWVSWLFGKWAELVEPNLVALHSSRGYETPSSKYFMRATVLISDVLVFFVGCHLLVTRSTGNGNSRSLRQALPGLVILLLHPAFIVIDHGHFQYNCVALGLVVAAVWSIGAGAELAGAVLFCLSIAFKQMALYYSPAFFFFLVARTWHAAPGSSLKFAGRIAAFAAVALLTFGLCLLPWLGSWADFAQVLHRIFPTARGLFEDKVANFWCMSNVLIKWHGFDRALLVRLSTAATLVAFLPGCLTLLRRGAQTQTHFLYALASSAFAFYLFSFQVHEKTILFPLLPCAVLAVKSRRNALLFAWLSVAAMTSMYPLLVRDGVSLPYFGLQLLFSVALASVYPWLPGPAPVPWMRAGCLLAHLTALAIHLLTPLVPHIPRYPDIVPLIYTAFGAVHFFAAFALLNLALLTGDGQPQLQDKGGKGKKEA